jgi:hypothetical protein
MTTSKKDLAKTMMLVMGIKLKIPGKQKIEYKNPIKTITRKPRNKN